LAKWHAAFARKTNKDIVAVERAVKDQYLGRTYADNSTRHGQRVKGATADHCWMEPPNLDLPPEPLRTGTTADAMPADQKRLEQPPHIEVLEDHPLPLLQSSIVCGR
jgi:hypothetical protein